MAAGSLWVAGGLLVMLPLAAWGQGMVEYSLGVGRAAATAPAAKKAGQAAAATFGKLSKTLEPAGGSPGAVAGGPSGTARPARVPKRLGPFLEPAAITAGLTLNQLLNRFGDPVLKTAGGLGTEAGETYWYRTGAGGHMLIEVREGAVTAVTTEAQYQARAAAVVVVQ